MRRTKNEKWYDEEVAPALLELARKCDTRGMAFISTVEYRPGHRGRTRALPKKSGLAMIMLDLCSQAGENVDSYIIGLIRYAKANNINTEASLVLRRMLSED